MKINPNYSLYLNIDILEKQWKVLPIFIFYKFKNTIIISQRNKRNSAKDFGTIDHSHTIKLSMFPIETDLLSSTRTISINQNLKFPPTSYTSSFLPIIYFFFPTNFQSIRYGKRWRLLPKTFQSINFKTIGSAPQAGEPKFHSFKEYYLMESGGGNTFITTQNI